MTDVPPHLFGEGGFDKGFFISLPLDLFFTRHTRRKGYYVFAPLTRDGGQMVSKPKPLYDLTSNATRHKIARGWGNLLD